MGAVFLLETTQTAFSCANLFYRFASGYGDMTRLVSIDLSFFGPIIDSVVALIVQIFYVYRIWVLSEKRSWWLCLLVCLVSWSRLGASLKHPSSVHLFLIVCHSRYCGRVHRRHLCECCFIYSVLVSHRVTVVGTCTQQVLQWLASQTCCDSMKTVPKNFHKSILLTSTSI